MFLLINGVRILLQYILARLCYILQNYIASDQILLYLCTMNS